MFKPSILSRWLKKLSAIRNRDGTFTEMTIEKIFKGKKTPVQDIDLNF